MARSKSPWGNPFGRSARSPRNPFDRQKPAERPALRRPELEQLLCKAIHERVLVSFLYEEDFAARLFGPSAVYCSAKGKICTYGIQQGDGPHNFEVGKMRSVQLTATMYAPEPINRLDDRYRNGIICSA